MPIELMTTTTGDNAWVYCPDTSDSTTAPTTSNIGTWPHVEIWEDYKRSINEFNSNLNNLINTITWTYTIPSDDLDENAQRMRGEQLTLKEQENEDFDTTEIDKYIETLEKEVVTTQK